MLDDFNIITTSPCLPTNGVFKTNVLFWIRVIFLCGNAVCFCRDNIKTKYEVFLEKLHHALRRSAVCMSKPPCKGAVPPFEKSIFLHNICIIIDIEHPFQKRNMFETVSTIKECSFAPYHRTTEYCPVWQKIYSCEEAAFLENWITFVWHVYSSLGQTSLHLDNSHSRKYFQYNPTIMFSFNQISHSYQGGVAQIQQQILQGRP